MIRWTGGSRVFNGTTKLGKAVKTRLTPGIMLHRHIYITAVATAMLRKTTSAAVTKHKCLSGNFNTSPSQDALTGPANNHYAQISAVTGQMPS